MLGHCHHLAYVTRHEWVMMDRGVDSKSDCITRLKLNASGTPDRHTSLRHFFLLVGWMFFFVCCRHSSFAQLFVLASGRVAPAPAVDHAHSRTRSTLI